MSKTRVLFVSQEMGPYTTTTEVSEVLNKLAPYAYNKGFDVRVLMPKYGSINERRHKLHEVVRLSGMNIIIDDDDYPLIIKVASLPGSRMQVYFLDNEEFFKRKENFVNDDGTPFEDNLDRMIFFCKGVMETVKKFGWAPDIIHCHGWMTSLVPVYFNKIYRQSPIFQDAKLIQTIYSETFEFARPDNFLTKACIKDLVESQLSDYVDNNMITLNHGALANADALIKMNDDLSPETLDKMNALGEENVLTHDPETYLADHLKFYKSLTTV